MIWAKARRHRPRPRQASPFAALMASIASLMAYIASLMASIAALLTSLASLLASLAASIPTGLRAFASALALAFVLAFGSGGGAAAHPHMFFDAQASFVFDDQGRLAGVRVGFVVDELNSLYSLSALQLDGDGDGKLTKAETDTIAASMMKGLRDYGYFIDLKAGKTHIKFAPPREATATFTNGMIGAGFLMPLEKPLPVSRRTLTLKLYDPTYYVEVTMLAPPTVAGATPKGCETGMSKFDPSSEVVQLQQLLGALGREETPDIDNIGEVFADTATLACGI